MQLAVIHGGKSRLHGDRHDDGRAIFEIYINMCSIDIRGSSWGMILPSGLRDPRFKFRVKELVIFTFIDIG